MKTNANFECYFHCRYTNKYIDIQKDLKEIYSSMQAFVISEEFQTHIKRDGYNLDNIEERLRLGKNDVIKTECPIVAAGKHAINII